MRVVFVVPGHYHTDIGNLAYESAKRFKDKISTCLGLHNMPSMSDIASRVAEECVLTDEHKTTGETKAAVYHAVFKSRVDRFPQNPQRCKCHKNLMHTYITFCISFITPVLDCFNHNL